MNIRPVGAEMFHGDRLDEAKQWLSEIMPAVYLKTVPAICTYSALENSSTARPQSDVLWWRQQTPSSGKSASTYQNNSYCKPPAFSCTQSDSLRVSINIEGWTMRSNSEAANTVQIPGSRNWHLHNGFACVPIYVARTTHVHLLSGFARCSTASGVLRIVQPLYNDWHAKWIWLCAWKGRRLTVAVVLVCGGGLSWWRCLLASP